MTARDRIVLMVVVALAAVAGAWMLVIQPKRTQASSLAAQVSPLQTQLTTAQSEVTKGLAARREFSGDYAQLAGLGEALPQSDDVPSLIYQVQNAASKTHVDFQTLNMQASSAPAPSTPAPTPGASASSSTTSSGDLPPGASVGPAGLPVEQFTFTFNGDFFHLSDFFNRLGGFVTADGHHIVVRGRLMTINAISLGPAADGFPHIVANVSATTYMAPATTGLTDGATPAGPAGSATPSSPTGSATAAAATITPPIR